MMYPMADYDVIVIGLGAMGSAAAHQLVLRGLRVLGIEQFTPAHTLGSSHGASRIVRKAYFERPDYVPLLVRAYELWDELGAKFGAELFTRCGALMIGRPESEVVSGTLASAKRWSLPHELLTPAQLHERFPQFALSEDQVAVYEADAGYVRPEVAVLANIELATDAGAELWFDTVVESVQLVPEGVRVVAGGKQVSAPKVVIATGAWAGRLADLNRYGVKVQRQTVHWFEPTNGADDFAADRFPVYMWALPVQPGEPNMELYGFPHLDGDRGVKAAIYRDTTNADVNPDTVDRQVTEQEHERVRELLARSIPALAGPHTDSTVCMYAGVADDDFVLGVHPGSSGRLVLAIGFSGHGFKFVPVVGEIVADLVIDGKTRHEIGFLSPDRVAAQ